MQENFDYSGVFDMTSEMFDKEKRNFSENRLEIKLNDPNIKDGVYEVYGRFVPCIASTATKRYEQISKSLYFLENPDPKEPGEYIDAPNNGKKPDIFTTAYMKHCYDKSKTYDLSTPVVLSQKCKKLQRYLYTWSLFLVYNDIQHPENNGKILIFRYGNVIAEKIEKIRQNNKTTGKPGIVPFNPFDGVDIVIKVGKGQNDRPDYTMSEWQLPASNISLDCGKTRLEDTPENRALLWQFLKDNTPLEEYMKNVYTDTTDTEMEKLTEYAKEIFGQQFRAQFESVYEDTFKKRYASPDVNKQNPHPSQQQTIPTNQTQQYQSTQAKHAAEKVEKENVVAQDNNMRSPARETFTPPTDTPPYQQQGGDAPEPEEFDVNDIKF